MADLHFNAHDVEPSAPFEPIPAGKYLACITNSQMKPTKNGAGQYLELTLTILDGDYKGRKVWDRLCLEHTNQQTVNIARATLSAICRAVGVMQTKDSVQLHDLPMLISVTRKKRTDNDQVTNEIGGYEPKQVAAGVPQQATSTPPWGRS